MTKQSKKTTKATKSNAKPRRATPAKGKKTATNDTPQQAKKESLADIAIRLSKLEAEKPKAPIHRRYKTNDGTIEKIGELLCENPNGLAIIRDELAGLIASWEKQGHESDRAFYLEAWNGCSSFDTDRIGRGTISIPNLCLSLFGGTQPDKMRALLDSMSDALANDGALQRFQLIVYPDPETWEWRDRAPNKEARDKVYDLFKVLAHFVPEDVGASPADEFNKFPYFNFSSDAQQVFIDWSTELHTKTIPIESNTFIVQHLGKYDKLFTALALILHLVDCAANKKAGAVSEAAALQAKAWCDYLQSHSRRCYGLHSDGGVHAALTLSTKLQEKKLKDGFTAHDVVRHGWSRLDKQERVQPALACLEDKGWIRAIPVPPTDKGGRSTIAYQINPNIKFKEKKHAENTEA